MTGLEPASRIRPVLEPLEARILLGGHGASAGLDGLLEAMGGRATAPFDWSGYEIPAGPRALAGGPAAPATATFEYGFRGKPVLDKIDDGFVVRLAGEGQWVNPGDPIVPARSSKILLPPGSQIVSAEVDPGPGVLLSAGVDLLAAPAPAPIYEGAPLDLEAALPPATASFPQDSPVRFSTQVLAGYSIGLVDVFPVRYDAASGTVTYYPQMKVSIRTGPAGAAAGPGLRDSPADRDTVLALVDNDGAIAEYASDFGELSRAAAPAAPMTLAGVLPDAGPHEYVVITSSALAGTFQTLVDHKRSAGLSATLVTVEYITANFTSPYGNENDPAGKLREFIAQAYAQWGTRWVLLGGDTGAVPVRTVYVTCGSYSATFCTDMYFACLDGPYNFTNDSNWGQSNDGLNGGEVDLAPEVYVGRAPVDTAAEAQNFISKVILYETTPPPHAITGVLIGEKLDSDPLTWGGDACDYIAAQTVPGGYQLVKLYERDGTCSADAVRRELNASPNFVHHVGHSSWNSNAKLTSADVEALTNAHPYVMYSQGCFAGQFEQSDAIGEYHLKSLHGAVAGVFNSHYGWYSPGYPQGSGTQWGLQFWDAVFNEGLAHLGEAHMDAKMDNLSSVSTSGSGRWLHFAATLFGDPQTRFYSARQGGPFVASSRPAGSPPDSVLLDFSEPMSPGGFDPAEDVRSFTGPGGFDLRGQITGFQWHGPYTLEVFFHPQAGAGTYEMVIGPDVMDESGRMMDQDHDGTPGEVAQDACHVVFAVASPGAPGTAYQASMDGNPLWTLDEGTGPYRWEWGVPMGIDGDPVSGRSGPCVLAYNLNGAYPDNMPITQYAATPPIDCRSYTGLTLDYWRWLRVPAKSQDYACIQISSEGQGWKTIWENDKAVYDSAWSRQTLDISAFADGRKDVRIRWGMGPTDNMLPYGGWNLDDVLITGRQVYPTVFAHAPAGQVEAGVDRLDLTFGLAINGGSFGLEDVSIVGPQGAVVPTGIAPLGGQTYRVSFPPQSAVGPYSIAVGPEIANTAGTFLDQDRDGIPGEPDHDVYRGAFEVVALDQDGPAVVGHSPDGYFLDPQGSVRFTFDEPMDTSSFDLGDIASFSGPVGGLPGQVLGYRWLDAITLEVAFRPQSAGGTYTMTIGPDIRDDAPGGNPMDQDGDGIAGQADDGYSASFTITRLDLRSEEFLVNPSNLEVSGGTVQAFFSVRAYEGVSPPFKVRFYLSDDQDIDPEGDLLLGLADGGDSYAVRALGMDETFGTSVRLVVPTADPFGTDNAYFLGAVIDADNDAPELDETNNSGQGLGIDMDEVRYGRISGLVWHDANGDRLRGPGEIVMPGWTVYVDANGNGSPDAGEPMTATRADGSYYLAGLADGTYTLRLAADASWMLTTPATGRLVVALAAGQTYSGADFGVCLPAAIAGGVFDDGDCDAAWDGGESGLDGWTVYLDADGDGVLDAGEPSQVTANGGAYAFTGLLPGTYTVRAILASDWEPTGPAGGTYGVVLASGQTSSGNHFGAIWRGAFRDGDDVPVALQGVRYAYYRHSGLASVDDLDGLAVQYGGTAANFDLSPADRSVDFGFIFTGFVLVPRDGLYTFFLQSDDGSRLYIGDRLVVDNDGAHVPLETSGRTGLKAGLHAFSLKYIQFGGGCMLGAYYQGPGILKTALPDAALFYAAEPDRDGAAVTSHEPSGRVVQAVGSVTFHFDEEMDVESFDIAEDLVGFEGPQGDLRGAIAGFAWTDPMTLEIAFAPQALAGAYAMEIGPGILDAAGNPMDQDGDGAPGEPAEDVCRAAFEIGSANLLSAEALDDRHVRLQFSHPLDAASAQSPDCYRLSHGLSAVHAGLGPGGDDVTLELDWPMSDGVTYTATVEGLRDALGNLVGPDGSASFLFRLLDTALLAWWTFDDGQGTVARDATGQGRDAQVVGASWVAQGRIGGALWFDGVDDYAVDEDGEAYLNGLSAVTVAVWLKADVIGTDRGWLTTRDPGSNECLNIRYDADGYFGRGKNLIKAYVQTTAGNRQYESPGSVQTTAWQHVALSWSSGNGIRIHINGVRQTPAYTSGAVGGTLSNVTRILLGQGYKPTNGAWRGLLDEVRIYGRQLSDEEVAALANLDPAAADDAYALDQDTALTVDPGEGLLANDADGDDGPQALRAELLTGPSCGQLQLAADGSFTYTPQPGYAGTDSFRYRAFDGREYSNIAVVTFDIRDTRCPLVAVDPVVTWDPTPPLSGTVDDPTAAVVIRLAGQTYQAVNRGDGTWLLPNDTIWPPLPTGTYDVEASAADAAGNVGLDTTQGELTVREAAAIVGRRTFYNGSAWDGGDPGAGAADDSAIAADKAALLPGQIATFANYTSYALGISGIMVDVAGLWDPAGLSAGDFEFRAGNGGDPSGWDLAAQPDIVAVRPGEGQDGADRITLIWTGQAAVRNRWLRVTVKATSTTGLVGPDVFYFGNAVGETGNSPADTIVNASDEIGARNHPHTFVDPAGIDDVYDFNRDRRVNATDQIIARTNRTYFLTQLDLFTAPTP